MSPRGWSIDNRGEPNLSIRFQEMLCVEAAVASSGAVDLPPGEEWTASQLLSLEALH
jgi:hypothetical protein